MAPTEFATTSLPLSLSASKKQHCYFTFHDAATFCRRRNHQRHPQLVSSHAAPHPPTIFAHKVQYIAQSTYTMSNPNNTLRSNTHGSRHSNHGRSTRRSVADRTRSGLHWRSRLTGRRSHHGRHRNITPLQSHPEEVTRNLANAMVLADSQPRPSAHTTTGLSISGSGVLVAPSVAASIHGSSIPPSHVDHRGQNLRSFAAQFLLRPHDLRIPAITAHGEPHSYPRPGYLRGDGVESVSTISSIHGNLHEGHRQHDAEMRFAARNEDWNEDYDYEDDDIGHQYDELDQDDYADAARPTSAATNRVSFGTLPNQPPPASIRWSGLPHIGVPCPDGRFPWLHCR